MEKINEELAEQLSREVYEFAHKKWIDLCEQNNLDVKDGFKILESTILIISTFLTRNCMNLLKEKEDQKRFMIQFTLKIVMVLKESFDELTPSDEELH